MTTSRQNGPDWDGHDWAGEAHPADEKRTGRWDSVEYAGEAPDDSAGEAMTDPGPSGGGHTPGEQHWVPERS